MNNSYIKKRNFNQSNYLNIAIIILIILIFVVSIMWLSNVNDEQKTGNIYSNLEVEIYNKAQEYIKNNSISTKEEIFIPISKLNIEIPNNCYMTSGIIVYGNTYNPYLYCSDYESEIIENDNSFVTLVGKKIYVIPKGLTFYDPGYVSSENVMEIGSVGKEEGVYNLYYVGQMSNIANKRKIIVIDDINIKNLYPTINLKGEEKVYVIQDNRYEEQGYTAYDNIEGDITYKVDISGNVNISKVGEYKLLYSVKNNRGFTSQAKRDVIVLSNISDLNVVSTISPKELTNDKVTIAISILGEDYDYSINPTGEKITDSEYTYTVSENGVYKFLVYDKKGRYVTKEITIDNINRTIPKGTCNAILYNDKTTVNVKITSSNFVVGYNYFVGNSESGFLIANTYNSSKKGITDIYVTVKDYVGNEGKIVCTIEDKQSSLDDNGIQTVIRGKPRLRIPISTALAKKGYSVSELNKCIYNSVKAAGPYTRYGVAAAAYALIDCTYSMTGTVLSYNHTSGKVEGSYCNFNSDICGKLGVNTRWGNSGGTCAKNGECWHGLNCATFVRWAMCNGGMDLCTRGSAYSHGMASTTYFPEADGVTIKGNTVTYYSGQNLTDYSAYTLVRMLKPGDVVASSEGGGHTFVVVGRDNNGIYTAEDGYYMRNIRYSDFTNGKEKYRLLFLDKYYANPDNYNNLYG